jgi:pimeloyl-ACP methyl ester carboxylesterase
MASMLYASREPDRLKGLVLVDVGPQVRLDGANRVADFVMAPAELDSVDEFVEKAHSFNPRRDPRLLRISLLHNLRRLPSGKWTWKYDRRHLSPEGFRDLTARLAELRTELPLIACPALVVRGASSDVFSDEDAACAAELLPDGRWVRIEGAGHTVQGDNPKALAHELREFLRGIGA